MNREDFNYLNVVDKTGKYVSSYNVNDKKLKCIFCNDKCWIEQSSNGNF